MEGGDIGRLRRQAGDGQLLETPSPVLRGVDQVERSDGRFYGKESRLSDNETFGKTSHNQKQRGLRRRQRTRMERRMQSVMKSRQLKLLLD